MENPAQFQLPFPHHTHCITPKRLNFYYPEFPPKNILDVLNVSSHAPFTHPRPLTCACVCHWGQRQMWTEEVGVRAAMRSVPPKPSQRRPLGKAIPDPPQPVPLNPNTCACFFAHLSSACWLWLSPLFTGPWLLWPWCPKQGLPAAAGAAVRRGLHFQVN